MHQSPGQSSFTGNQVVDAIITWMFDGELHIQIAAVTITTLCTLLFRYLSAIADRDDEKKFWTPTTLNLGWDYLVAGVVAAPLLWFTLVAPTQSNAAIPLTMVSSTGTVAELEAHYDGVGVPRTVLERVVTAHPRGDTITRAEVEREVERYRFELTNRAAGTMFILGILMIISAVSEGRYFGYYRNGQIPKNGFDRYRARRVSQWGGGVIAPGLIGVLGLMLAVSAVTP